MEHPPVPCRQCEMLAQNWQAPVPLDYEAREPVNWPDIIQFIGGRPSFVVTEKITDMLRAADLSFDTVEMHCHGKKLGLGKYYIMQPPRVLDMDLGRSGFIYGSTCELCGLTKIKKRPSWASPGNLVPNLASWNGELLFRGRNFDHDGIYCSFEFIQLARANRWKGFCFSPLRLNIPPNETQPLEIEDYLTKDWPPQYIDWGHEGARSGDGYQVPDDWTEPPPQKVSLWKTLTEIWKSRGKI